jgi:hypothetical protein
MGSYNSWKLTIEETDIRARQLIIDTANGMKDFTDGPKIEDFMWFRWSEEVKWWASEFTAGLSKEFPETIFRLDCRGDDNFTWFFLDGAILSESDIWTNPRFPSRPLFKKKLQETALKRAEQKRIHDEKVAKAEKEKLEKQLAELKAKQQELEDKLLRA